MNPSQQPPVPFVVMAGIAAVVVLVLLFNLSRFILIWVRAMIANAPVPFITLVAMNMRRVPVSRIMDSYLTAVKGGIDVSIEKLEAHHLAGGDVPHLVLALIAADKAGIALDFNRACAIDLMSKGTGKSLLDTVRFCIAQGAKEVTLKQWTS
jgi:uncharacterized protein YqfA (UPF0365 family)